MQNSRGDQRKGFGHLATNVHVAPNMHGCNDVNGHVSKHLEQVGQFFIVVAPGGDGLGGEYLSNVPACHY